jgi:D-aspartate ligase
MHTAPSAIILGLGENGYGILRGLARAGVSVTGFYTGPEEFGRYSKHCETRHLPSFLDDAGICDALVKWGRRTGTRPVLFPTSDRYVSLLARHGKDLSEHFRFHWVDAQVLASVVDKARMVAICRGAGVRAPRTHVVRAEEYLPDLATRLSYPCLIKPNRTFDTPFPPRCKNFVAASPAQLLDFYEQHPALRGATVCQEIIEGGDENIFQCTVLMRSGGQPGAVFCARKLHQYRPGYGVMCFGRSEANEIIAAESQRLLRALLRYRGLASLEFKYRARDGRYYFIEMNARLPWYNALCSDAGVNLPHLAYLDLTENQPAAGGVKQRNGVHWISLKLDLGWFVQSWMAGRGAGLASWLRSIARARSYAWFDWRDPVPFVRATADLLTYGFRDLLRVLLDKSRPPVPADAVTVHPDHGRGATT